MRDLRLIGVHDDGEHLVVADDTGEEYRLRIDDPLRAAARRDRPRLGQLQIAIDNTVRPREVQAMIRAGATTDEVAARTGWDLDKIARFEGPVLAEREHIASRAQGVRLRGTNQAGSPETLAQRAATRLVGRGVDPTTVEWDSSRDAEGQWTVSAVFSAGGRERTATWWFDLAGMSVVARNDEAKWLSEADTPAGPVPAAVHRPTAVFDVEVEETKVERATRANTDDLINSMREHSGAKSRRRGGRRKGRPGDGLASSEDALPLETPDGQALPPAARGPHPLDLQRPAKDEPARPAADEGESVDFDHEVTDGTDEAGTPDVVEETAVPRSGEPEPAGSEPARTEPAQTEPARTEPAPAEEMKAEPEPAGTKEEPVDQSGEGASDQAGATAEASSKGRGRKGRASVPSWDDVMFGTTRD